MNADSTPTSEPNAFEKAATAMVELAAAWAKLHDALVKIGEDKALRP